VAVAGSTFFFIVLCQWFLIELSVLQEDPQVQMPSSPQSVCEQKCVCKFGTPHWPTEIQMEKWKGECSFFTSYEHKVRVKDQPIDPYRPGRNLAISAHLFP
jgi:hypothetical protein